MSMVMTEKPESKGDLLSILQGKDFLEKIGSVMPRHMKADRMLRVMFMALRKTPKLLQCTHASVQESMMIASSLGLEPDGRVAHLIPYENRIKVNGQWKSVLVCQFQLDYKGLAQLVMQSGYVSYLHADVIYPGDLFKYDRGQLVSHIPWFIRTDSGKPELRGDEPFCAYAYAKMKDGNEKTELMSRDDIFAIRNRSQGWKAFIGKKITTIPWDPDYPTISYEMWKKTVFKRMSKWLPLSPEIRDLMEREDAIEFPDMHGIGSVANLASGLDALADSLGEDSPVEGHIESSSNPSASSEAVEGESVEYRNWLTEIKLLEDRVTASNIRREIDLGGSLPDIEKDKLIKLIDEKFPE